MAIARAVKPTTKKAGNLTKHSRKKLLPAHGWQNYLAAKDDVERLAVELTDDDVMKLVLLNFAAGHPRPTTETLHSWKRNGDGRIVAEVHGPRGVMEITCK